MKQGKHSNHDFLRRVVTLCLVMMVLLTVETLTMSIVAGVPPDAASLGVLMGGWDGELLMSLLKRKIEQEDKAKEEETECKSGTT